MNNDEILAALTRLEEKIDKSTTAVDKIVAAIEPHIPEIARTIDAIQEHPMFKMFLGKKK